MSITLHLHSWHLALAITLAWIIITTLVGRAEAKQCGDFGIPVFTIVWAFGGVAATFVAWGMWAAMHFVH